MLVFIAVSVSFQFLFYPYLRGHPPKENLNDFKPKEKLLKKTELLRCESYDIAFTTNELNEFLLKIHLIIDCRKQNISTKNKTKKSLTSTYFHFIIIPTIRLQISHFLLTFLFYRMHLTMIFFFIFLSVWFAV